MAAGSEMEDAGFIASSLRVAMLDGTVKNCATLPDTELALCGMEGWERRRRGGE